MHSSFEGEWSLHRTISDGTYMTGKAVLIKKIDQTLGYKEKGLFHTQRGILDFFQHYIFVLSPLLHPHYEPAHDQRNEHIPFTLSLYFPPKKEIEKDSSHKRLFMQFSPQGKGIHSCQNDLYQGSFNIMNKGSFALSFTVKGPRKDHRIHTLYTRL